VAECVSVGEGVLVWGMRGRGGGEARGGCDRECELRLRRLSGEIDAWSVRHGAVSHVGKWGGDLRVQSLAQLGSAAVG
jgi:hypothetical protein